MTCAFFLLREFITNTGRYVRWIEIDPDRAKVFRLAWELLVTDRFTLAEICEQLHEKGYTYRSGRPFIEVKENGKRSPNKNTLAAAFKNWAYAGWVVNKEYNILPKTLRGVWEPIVSTEVFEKGLAILAKRSTTKSPKRKHVYLLSGLIYLHIEKSKKLKRMTCSTSNPGHSGGGTSYYRVQGISTRLICSDIDVQLGNILKQVQLCDEQIELVRNYYTTEVRQRIGSKHPSEKAEIEANLRSIDEEEKRTARLYAIGKITDYVWDSLWREWQDRRYALRASLEALAYKSEYHISHLDDALNIISQIGVLYERLELRDQKRLLHEVVDKVVVNKQGNILRLELLPPFAYLSNVSEQIGDGDYIPKNTKASNAGSCSTQVFLGGLHRTRTCNLLDVNEALCQLS